MRAFQNNSRRGASASRASSALPAVAAGSATAGSDGDRTNTSSSTSRAPTSAAAHQAVADAGGKIVSENAAIGVATVHTDDAELPAEGRPSSARWTAPPPTGPSASAPDDSAKPPRRDREARRSAQGHRQGRQEAQAREPRAGEPLADLQWDMQHDRRDRPTAPTRVQQGSHAVRVGIIDTGIDGSHPDIAPNFDARAVAATSPSTTRRSTAPCADEPDQSCDDAANVDEDGHGTHVAGTIGSPLNGVGIGGVAPKVDLVNLRAGQDSGYFFLGPTARRADLRGRQRHRRREHVVLHRPVALQLHGQPGRLPAEQREQKLDHRGHAARDRLRARQGRHDDRGRGQRAHRPRQPDVDDTSPDYPPTAPRHARRSTTRACRCRPRPTASSASPRSGPSERKAYYSDYGVEQADVSAPGGDGRDTPRPPRTDPNLILAAYPENARRAASGDDRRRRQPDDDRSCVKHGQRVLPVDPGHLDGLAARGRRRRPDRGAQYGKQRPQQPGRDARRPTAWSRSSSAPRPTRRARTRRPFDLHRTSAPTTRPRARATPRSTGSTATGSSTRSTR